MLAIKLFNGMDFSGKSTVVKTIMEEIPGKYTYREKFVTPINTLQYMIENDIWIPPKEKFIPLLIQLTEKDLSDLSNYRDGLILQDTIWAIKYLARLKASGNDDYKTEIQQLFNLLKKYPQCESYFFTASLEERKRRYKKRKAEGKRISRSDQLIFNPTLFNAIEDEYKTMVFDLFPNTRIIDTTNNAPYDIAQKILSD